MAGTPTTRAGRRWRRAPAATSALSSTDFSSPPTTVCRRAAPSPSASDPPLAYRSWVRFPRRPFGRGPKSSTPAVSADELYFLPRVVARELPPTGSTITGSSVDRYVLKDFRGSSHRILASWIRELPQGVRLLELGPGDGHVARLAHRADLAWKGLESSVACLPALVEVLDGGAIVDL